MNSLPGNNYDFLKEITPANFAKAKASFQFKFNNYTTLYAVDTFDIIEFCFPAIFNTSLQDNSQMNISSFLGYEFFFFQYPQKHILLQEHRVELYSFWQRIRRRVREFSSYKNLKSEMLGHYKKLRSDKEKIYFIESNIGILLALTFGALSETAFDRFTKLITEKLQIQSVTVEEPADRQKVEEIFLDTKPDTSLVNNAFDHFCEEKKFNLLQMTEEEQANYLEGVYRDIKAFDKIIRINQKLSEAESENQLSRKYNVLLLSSVTKKIDVIEAFYRDYLPIYEQMPGESIHRNNMEVYLFQLLNVGESDEQKKMIIDLLEKLENVSRSYIDNAGKIDQYKKLFLDNKETLNSRLLENGTDIDDIFLKYHSIREYKDKIDEAIKTLKSTKQDAELLTEFKNILNQSVEQKTEKALSELEHSIDYYTSLMTSKTDIISDIDFLKQNKDTLKLQIRQGKDSVKSTIQSFPILLFYKKRSIAEIQKLFKHLINPQEKDQSILMTLIKTPRQLLYEFSTYEKKVFYLFVRYLFDSNLKDEDLLIELDEYLQLNLKSRTETSFMEGPNLQVHFRENTNLRMDILYFQTWVLRRNNEYNKAIEIIDKEEKQAIGNFDVRLIHSRALCYKSWYYKRASVESADMLEGYLTEALTGFFICEKLYSSFQKNDMIPVLMVEIMSAISNSIIDTFTKLYLLDNKKYSANILEGRKRLIDLKNMIPVAGAKYDSYSAFGHTEIDLEFCEARIAMQEDNMELARKKIQAANERLENIQASDNFESYEAFDTSKNLIRKLARTLLRN